VYAEVHSLVGIGDGVMRLRATVSNTILFVGVERLRCRLPEGMTLLEVSGAGIRDWKAREDGTLDVLLNYAAEGAYVLELVAEKVVGEESRRLSAPIVVPLDVILPPMRPPSDEEEKYFKALEIEQRQNLRDKLDRDAAALERRRAVAEGAGTEDLDVAARIAALGFSGDSARIFDLMPLVHVAWADGAVTRRERSTILKILERRGIAPGSDAFTTMEALLEQPPPESFMRESLAVLRDLVADRSGDIVSLCLEVARASGGFLGLGHAISDNERAILEEVATTLGDTAATNLRTQLD
jgi:uncharacterized tellurite resistance protein B-like protein